METATSTTMNIHSRNTPVEVTLVLSEPSMWLQIDAGVPRPTTKVSLFLNPDNVDQLTNLANDLTNVAALLGARVHGLTFREYQEVEAQQKEASHEC
jgi:hypothetical protein